MFISLFDTWSFVRVCQRRDQIFMMLRYAKMSEIDYAPYDIWFFSSFCFLSLNYSSMFFVSLSVYFCTLSVYWFIHLSTSFDTHHAIPILFPVYLALSHVRVFTRIHWPVLGAWCPEPNFLPCTFTAYESKVGFSESFAYYPGLKLLPLFNIMTFLYSWILELLLWLYNDCWYQ